MLATSRDGSTGNRLDVADANGFSRFSDDLGDQAVDLLVCNAGVYLDKGQEIDSGYPAGMWADTFAVNVTGVFLTVQAALTRLRQAQAPKIAIISSLMASQELAPGGSYIYRASKAALNMLLKTAAIEFSRRAKNIKLIAFHPGTTDSPLSAPFQHSVADDALFTPEFVAERLLSLCDAHAPDGQLSYLDWAGKPIAW